ncbi:MAG: N-formylglutamate amidohydrolase [Magnetospirillum sp.]|nr:N-formylglutamate amidohydrolase [Magnetospirillum sp.]
MLQVRAAETDPPPFEAIDGAAGARVLIVCDHASPLIPARYAGLGLAEAVQGDHVGWDIGAAAVARGLARHLGCPAVLSGVSRLVIDCNRGPGDPGSIPACTCGVAVPGNAGLDAREAEARAAAWFRPYHREIAARLAALRRHGVPAMVSVHSFTPCLDGWARPWQVGVLWNRDGRMAEPVMAGLRARGLTVGDNQPYSGREINYTLDTHAGAAGLPHVSVEIRQDGVSDAAGTLAWAALLAAVLGPVLADPALYRLME